MSAENGNNSDSTAASDAASVLANLPRTRPQRSSPRRLAARAATAASEPAGVSHDTPQVAQTVANGRPQRRASAGAKAASPAKAQPGARKRASRVRESGAAASSRESPTAARQRGAAAPAASAKIPPAPKQGFECESERASRTVQPPGGAELVASAAEIVGALFKSGLSTGERLLKDVFSHLPLA